MPELEDIIKKEANEHKNPHLSEQGTEQENEKAILPESEINTDGKGKYDWKSKYPDEARREMCLEAVYIGVILVLTLTCLLLHWRGIIENLLRIDTLQRVTFKRMGYYFLSGLLGGTIYGMKYFYRVIARGYWSQDRRYWRIFSPWISASIALIVGCMIVSGLINSAKPPSNYSVVCFGFFAGHFADDAVSKMSEVAKALFGSGGKSK